MLTHHGTERATGAPPTAASVLLPAKAAALSRLVEAYFMV